MQSTTPLTHQDNGTCPWAAGKLNNAIILHLLKLLSYLVAYSKGKVMNRLGFWRCLSSINVDFKDTRFSFTSIFQVEMSWYSSNSNRNVSTWDSESAEAPTSSLNESHSFLFQDSVASSSSATLWIWRT